MLICVIDLETTGLDATKGAKIIEIAMLTYDMESRALVDSYVQRFNPERAIDPKAQAVHGICFEDLIECPKFAEKVDEVVSRLKKADYILAHNLGFDAPFVGVEIVAAGEEIPELSGICSMSEARWACPDGKLPRLGELCFALGVEYDVSKAHGAEYDVEVTAECFFRGFDRGFYELPKPLRNAAEMKVAA